MQTLRTASSERLLHRWRSRHARDADGAVARGQSDAFVPTLAGQPPRLVLRFAVLTAVCLGVAAAAILGFVRHLNTVEAQRAAAQQAEFVASGLLEEKLRGTDFARPVSRARRAELDRFFDRAVLANGVLLVTLSRADRVVTYSTDHTLIGRPTADAARTREAFEGTLTSAVTTIAAADAPELEVLQSYVPVAPRGGGTGVVGIYQDYAPIAEAASAAFFPIAGILELVLVVLYILLVPLLARVARRIRRQVEHIEHMAFHDDLTELPNRLHFRKRIAAALADSPHSELAVLLLNVDRFKAVNDTLGHQSGDELLELLGRRIRDAVPDRFLAARLGGDGFGIVAPGRSALGALELAAHLRQSLDAPFVVNSVPLVVEASIGVAVSPADGEDVETLIQRADIAMYAAKEKRLGVLRYAPELDTSSAAQLSLMADLRRALDEDELVLHFQPKVSLATGGVAAVEALVRWEHPVHGFLQPGEFVPFAERTGLIRGLTRVVLTRAAEQLRAWSDAGIHLDLSVNLTMFDLLDLSLPEEVAGILERAGIDPRRLEVEITESVIMADALRVRDVVTRLKEIGVSIAIDDFGTGFSSLTYLKTLPVDVVKVDRSFVMGMLTDESDRAIVRATTDLGHSLGLRVTAEGVESQEVWEELVRAGCDVAQGYHIARPVAGIDLPGAVEAWNERYAALAAPKAKTRQPRAKRTPTRRAA
ncbi:MAG: putative bifunctional diguanylate cyclase/phosphodiesterase [Gaiellaceae bacterium]